MPTDPLRCAIERALPCDCDDSGVLHALCPKAHANDVHAAVAPLLAAAREEGRRDGIEEAARFCCDAARVTVGEAARDAIVVLAETLPMLLDAPREETRKP